MYGILCKNTRWPAPSGQAAVFIVRLIPDRAVDWELRAAKYPVIHSDDPSSRTPGRKLRIFRRGLAQVAGWDVKHVVAADEILARIGEIEVELQNFGVVGAVPVKGQGECKMILVLQKGVVLFGAGEEGLRVPCQRVLEQGEGQAALRGVVGGEHTDYTVRTGVLIP